MALITLAKFNRARKDFVAIHLFSSDSEGDPTPSVPSLPEYLMHLTQFNRKCGILYKLNLSSQFKDYTRLRVNSTEPETSSFQDVLGGVNVDYKIPNRPNLLHLDSITCSLLHVFGWRE